MSSVAHRLSARLPLLLICGASLALAWPTINNYVNDPNLITYFSADEGGQMDVTWWHYSGEKRESFQWESDYGLELIYFADIARLALSRFVTVTPGLFVVIARWVHLLAWLGACVALWQFVGRHVQRGWPQTLAVSLLAVRPAFAYLCNNWKPDPLVLWLMIVGLDAVLRHLDTPSWRHVMVATACAAVVSIVKYAGVFLLPALVAAMYFSVRRSPTARAAHPDVRYPQWNASWAFYGLMGGALLSLLVLMIYRYQRHSTGGLTWYQQYGLWGSLAAHPGMLMVAYVSGGLMLLSLVLWRLARSRQPSIRRAMRWVNEVNTYLCLAGGIFVAWVPLVGFRWLVTPEHFIASASQFGPRAASSAALQDLGTQGFWGAFAHNAIGRIMVFDGWLFVLVLASLGFELLVGRRQAGDQVRWHKQCTLLVFLAPLVLLIASMVHVAAHNMLPFVVAACVLVLSSLALFHRTRVPAPWRSVVMSAVGLMLAIDLVTNAAAMLTMRRHAFRQRKDMVFDLARWWQQHIPPDARIVADFHTRVYIPSGYGGIKVFKGYQQDRVEQLRRLVSAYEPAWLYYNAGPSGGTEPLPPVEEMLPGWHLTLVKEFDSADYPFQRIPGDRFIIYRLTKAEQHARQR